MQGPSGAFFIRFKFMQHFEENAYDLFLKGKLFINESDIKEVKKLRRYLNNCTAVAISKSKIFKILLAVLDKVKEKANESKCNNFSEHTPSEASIPSSGNVRVAIASSDQSKHSSTNQDHEIKENLASPPTIAKRHRRIANDGERQLKYWRTTLTTLHAIIGEKQSDKDGCGIIATRDLQKGEFFVNYIATYHKGKPPDSLLHPRGHHIKIDTSPEAYMSIRPSYFEFINEPRNGQVANAEFGVHREKSNLKLRLKVRMLSDVKKGDEILCIYDVRVQQ